MMKSYIVLFLCALFALASAGYLAVSSARAADCEQTYQSFGKSFMETYCTRCHASDKTGLGRNGAPEGLDFDKPEVIAKEKADILKWVVDKGKMPPRGDKPTAEEKAKLQAWLGCEYQ